MKLMELAGLVEKSDKGKEDVEVRSSALKVNELGELVVDGRTLRPNDWGWYSLFAKASKGTTKRYMVRHPVEQWVGMVNYDLENSGDEKWVLRTRGDEVLGVVSGSYKKFDNQSVVKALIDNLGEDSPVHRYHLDDKFFFVRALYPGGDFKIDGEGEGVYHIGFTTFNSEVGFRSLGTAAFIYKKPVRMMRNSRGLSKQPLFKKIPIPVL